jgi:RNA polymerase sigma factor (sigma-70 family)
VVVRYYEDLLRFCSRSVKDADTARDVVQETYARFLASRQAADGTVRQPGAVLHQIARHLLVDQHRRAVVRAHEDIDGLDEADEPIAPTHLQPDALLSSAQSVRAYLSTIESLPPRCREAFVLHVFDGMSHARIAEKMGISCSMVEKHIVRGMVACKLCERNLSADHVPEPSASKP